MNQYNSTLGKRNGRKNCGFYVENLWWRGKNKNRSTLTREE